MPELSPPRPGDRVVVQTEGGPAVGTVVRAIPQLDAKRRPAGRLAAARRPGRDAGDIVARLKHQHREQEAYRIALLKIRERGLGMKLTRVEQAFDGSKLVFYFTADGRVDFRELVRELAAEFRTRIEMRQIGVRDEAKMYRRLRHLRPAALLHDVPAVVRAGLDQDGQAAGPEPQSVEAVRAVRPAEVLPALRAAERQGRAARRLRQRRRLRQSVRLRIRRRLRIGELRIRRLRLLRRLTLNPRSAV